MDDEAGGPALDNERLELLANALLELDVLCASILAHLCESDGRTEAASNFRRCLGILKDALSGATSPNLDYLRSRALGRLWDELRREAIVMTNQDSNIPGQAWREKFEKTHCKLVDIVAADLEGNILTISESEPLDNSMMDVLRSRWAGVDAMVDTAAKLTGYRRVSRTR